MVRRALRFAILSLLWVGIILCMAVVLVPPFLDRIYYRGPTTAHFDGERFFNPTGDDTARPPTGGSRAGFFWRQIAGDGRPAWPDSITVTPVRPQPRVAGQAMQATWIGHATVLVQTQGLNILTDPVWSPRAGPFGFGPARATPPAVTLADLPPVDLIVVSHNHYDHMDLATLKALWDRDRPLIVTSLGNDAILRSRGIPARALDWGDSAAAGPAQVHVVRNHHWGSRWFADRNRALWSGFVVALPGGNVFFAGDTGFGDGRWPAEAAALGPVRFAIVPIGAFRFTPGQLATASHIGPPQAIRVVERLGATTALPIHWGTFRLSYEARDTPPRLLDVVTRCAGGDPARFAPRQVGASFAVPAYAPPATRADERRIDACAQTPEARALR